MGSTHPFCTSEAAAIASSRNLATAWKLATLHQQSQHDLSNKQATLKKSDKTVARGHIGFQLHTMMRKQVHTPMALYAPERTCHPPRLVATSQQTDVEAPSERTNQASSRTSEQPSTQSVNQSLAVSDLSVFQCASFTQNVLLRMVVLLCHRKCCPTRFTSMAKGGCDRLGNPLDLPSV